MRRLGNWGIEELGNSGIEELRHWGIEELRMIHRRDAENAGRKDFVVQYHYPYDPLPVIFAIIYYVGVLISKIHYG